MSEKGFEYWPFILTILIGLIIYLYSNGKINLKKFKMSGSVGNVKNIPITPVLWVISGLMIIFWLIPEVFPNSWDKFRNSSMFLPTILILAILLFLKFVKYNGTAGIVALLIIIFVVWKFGGCSSNAPAGETDKINFRLYFKDGSYGVYQTPCTLNLVKGFNIESDGDIWFTVPGVSGVQHHQPGVAKTIPAPSYNGDPSTLLYKFYSKEP